MSGSDAIEDLRFAIEWYVDAIPSSTRRPFGPPMDPVAVDEALAEIDAAIAPLRLPPEVRWLWRTWDPHAFDVVPYPTFCDPGFALESWRMNVADAGFPRALFPVAYESHGFLLIEVVQEVDQPAAVWYVAYTDSDFVCTYPSLAALFRSCAQAIEASGVPAPTDDERYTTYSGLLDGPAFRGIVDRHFAASPGTQRCNVPQADARAWPQSWRVAEGIDDELLAPRGRTHTVADFDRASRGGPVTGRMRGRWRTQAGGGLGPDGAMVSIGVLTDDTGSISLVLPASVVDVGGRDGVVDVEVDVEASGPPSSLPNLDTREIQEAALAGDLDTASSLGAELARSLQDATRGLPVIHRLVPLD